MKELWYEVFMRISNPQSESFVEVSLESVENFRWSWKAVVPLYKKPWGSMGARKDILEFIVSLPDEGGRFISFSVFHFIFENFDLSVNGVRKGGLRSWHRSNIKVLLAQYRSKTAISLNQSCDSISRETVFVQLWTTHASILVS